MTEVPQEVKISKKPKKIKEVEKPQEVMPDQSLWESFSEDGYDGSRLPYGFIIKFKNCREHYSWDEKKKKNRLILVLQGQALEFVTAYGMKLKVEKFLKNWKYGLGRKIKNLSIRQN